MGVLRRLCEFWFGSAKCLFRHCALESTLSFHEVLSGLQCNVVNTGGIERNNVRLHGFKYLWRSRLHAVRFRYFASHLWTSMSTVFSWIPNLKLKYSIFSSVFAWCHTTRLIGCRPGLARISCCSQSNGCCLVDGITLKYLLGMCRCAAWSWNPNRHSCWAWHDVLELWQEETVVARLES